MWFFCLFVFDPVLWANTALFGKVKLNWHDPPWGCLQVSAWEKHKRNNRAKLVISNSNGLKCSNVPEKPSALSLNMLPIIMFRVFFSQRKKDSQILLGVWGCQTQGSPGVADTSVHADVMLRDRWHCHFCSCEENTGLQGSWWKSQLIPPRLCHPKLSELRLKVQVLFFTLHGLVSHIIFNKHGIQCS